MYLLREKQVYKIKTLLCKYDFNMKQCYTLENTVGLVGWGDSNEAYKWQLIGTAENIYMSNKIKDFFLNAFIKKMKIHILLPHAI